MIVLRRHLSNSSRINLEPNSSDGYGQQEKAYSGARALAFSAPQAPEAFSILTNGLTDSAAGARDAASMGLIFA